MSREWVKVLRAEELKRVERAFQERCNAGLAFQRDHRVDRGHGEGVAGGHRGMGGT